MDIPETNVQTLFCLWINNPYSSASAHKKGGVGKSTFTILLANWLHYALGRDVLVVDCDAPQWSIVAQRERGLDVLERNDRYKLMMVRLFKRTGRKIWPVVRSTPYEGLQAAHAYLAAGDREADFVLLDLPGTVAAPGIFRLLARLDHLFIPLKADKLVLESALSFARAVDERLVHNDAHRLTGLHLFWTMVDWRNIDCVRVIIFVSLFCTSQLPNKQQTEPSFSVNCDFSYSH